MTSENITNNSVHMEIHHTEGKPGKFINTTCGRKCPLYFLKVMDLQSIFMIAIGFAQLYDLTASWVDPIFKKRDFHYKHHHELNKRHKHDPEYVYQIKFDAQNNNIQHIKNVFMMFAKYPTITHFQSRIKCVVRFMQFNFTLQCFTEF